jgi:hypothetical protein
MKSIFLNLHMCKAPTFCHHTSCHHDEAWAAFNPIKSLVLIPTSLLEAVVGSSRTSTSFKTLFRPTSKLHSKHFITNCDSLNTQKTQPLPHKLHTPIIIMFRQQIIRQVRLFSTTPVARKSPVETVKDAAKAIDKTISGAAVKGIEKGGTYILLSPMHTSPDCVASTYQLRTWCNPMVRLYRQEN